MFSSRLDVDVRVSPHHLVVFLSCVGSKEGNSKHKEQMAAALQTTLPAHMTITKICGQGNTKSPLQLARLLSQPLSYNLQSWEIEQV